MAKTAQIAQTPAATPDAAATPAAAAPKQIKVPATFVHRLTTPMKTQTLKGTMSVADLDEIIAFATKMKDIAAILHKAK